MGKRLPTKEQVVGCSRTLFLGVSFSADHFILETEAQSIEADLSYFAMYQLTSAVGGH